MKFKYNKKVYTYHQGVVYTKTGRVAKEQDKLVKSAESLIEYYDSVEPFRLSFKEFDQYLETRSSEQKAELFHYYMEAYLGTGEWIRKGKITSKDLERGINLLKKYELLIGKIIES